MNTHTVKVGIEPNENSNRRNSIREVEFEGELLGKVHHNGSTGRSSTFRLFDTGQGLVLHARHKSNWVGESTEYKLETIDPDKVRESLPDLARDADIDEPMALEEAL